MNLFRTAAFAVLMSSLVILAMTPTCMAVVARQHHLPRMLWAQTIEHVQLTMRVPGCTNEIVEFTRDGVSFRGVSGAGESYGANLSFSGRIVPENSSWKKTARGMCGHWSTPVD